MKKLHYLILTISASCFLLNYSCSNQPNENAANGSAEGKAPKEEKVKSVCVYNYSANGLQVVNDLVEAKHLTFVKLGESLVSMGIKDTLKGKDYTKIELSDGTIGWARSDYIIENAYPAAIIEKTPVYDRPDILTKSSKKDYNQIDFAAVVDTKDDWLNVVGINMRDQGWIKKGVVSTNKEDITMAILAVKELYDNDKIKEDKINDFIKNAPFSESRVIGILKNMVQEPAPEEAMEEAGAGMVMEGESEDSGN